MRCLVTAMLLLPALCWAGPSAKRSTMAPHPDVTIAVKKAQVYAWLKSLPTRSDNKIISGQMSWSNSIIDSIQTSYGKKPGLRGFDWFAQAEPATDALAWAQSGGIIQLMYHMPNPFAGNAAYNILTNGNWTNLVTNGTTENTNWKVSLDQMAATLTTLQNAKVVVLLRPLHEMNGTWFWWGKQNCTTAQFIAAWQYMYNYLVTTKGLNNLIWIYGPNTDASATFLTNRYPGDAYVDMVSLDVYATGFTNEADLLSAFPSKPFAVAEYGGCVPSGCDPGGYDISTIPSSVPARTLFWMNWESGAGGYFGLDQHNAGTADIFTNPLVITLDEMPTF